MMTVREIEGSASAAPAAAATAAAPVAEDAQRDREPAILIEGARKSFGAHAVGRAEAVSGVTLRVERGTVHGLLGPNGAGKTTTLKMLLGLVRPSGGVFRIGGAPAHDPGARARLGFLPEQPYYPQQLTAGEVLSLHVRLRGGDPRAATAEMLELLERVGLEDRASTRLSRFSRGMLQRLGLAVALLGSPDVVVLDEPASGLDPVGQRDVRDIILDMRARGAGVLLSSHQLSEIETVCDDVTILHKGTVAARGDINELLGTAGFTTVKTAGAGDLPHGVEERIAEKLVTSGVVVFSVRDEDVRAVVDALDDAGWRIVGIAPKRESLEEYFSRLVSDSDRGEGVR